MAVTERLVKEQGGIITEAQMSDDPWDVALGTRRRESVRFREITEGTPHQIHAYVTRIYDRLTLRYIPAGELDVGRSAVEIELVRLSRLLGLLGDPLVADGPRPVYIAALAVDFLPDGDWRPRQDGPTIGEIARAEAARRERILNAKGIAYVPRFGGGVVDVESPSEAVAAAMQRLVEYRRMHEEAGPSTVTDRPKTDAEQVVELGIYPGNDAVVDKATGVAVRGGLVANAGRKARKGVGV